MVLEGWQRQRVRVFIEQMQEGGICGPRDIKVVVWAGWTEGTGLLDY